MAGMEYEGKKPFNEVYFTGIVRDKLGRKMSKQLGNSPDLLGLIDKYGADAVRFGIMIASPAGNDLMWDEASNEQGLHFNNKMWNALKLVKIWESRVGDIQSDAPLFAVEWFENRLREARLQLEELYRDFRLSEALKTLYSLIWDDFCSWYLEWVKPGFEQPIDPRVYQKSVAFFEELMQLLHPFMPFITEEIYHQLREQAEDLTVKQLSPLAAADPAILQKGTLLKEIITALRDARVRAQLKPKDPVRLYVQSDNAELYEGIGEILARQINAESLGFVNQAPDSCISLVVQKYPLFLETMQERDTEAERQQLEKDLDYYRGFLASVEKKLANEKFVQNAKPEVVDVERKKKADAEARIRTIEESLSKL